MHYDRWARVGVLFLAKGPLVAGGTAFYRHLPTGFTSVHQADAAGKRRQLMNDSTRMDAELIAEVPIRFNRMILFSPHLFHQALCYFKRRGEDARLYNIVAFDGPLASRKEKST